MVRTTLAPDVRRAQILDVAERLFRTQGYAATSVDDIVRAAGVAKGTFYYHYRAKPDVLAALASRLVEALADDCRAIADDPDRRPLDKLRAIIAVQMRPPGAVAVEDLHRPENRELHERSNIEIVTTLGPIVAAVVEEGCREGVFTVDEPLATVQFILAGALFLFGDGVFNWTPAQWLERQSGMARLIERGLGAGEGALAGLFAELDPTRS